MKGGLLFDEIVGRSKAIMEVKKLIVKVTPSSSSVLIEGETGTGKELVAKAVHFLSPRKDKPFEIINCSGLQDTLVESEMFGHTKGSFTGASTNKVGLFETCNGGTIFLDEISTLSPQAQAKFLRAIENGEIRQLGSNKTIKVDVRIVAATNVDLSTEVQKGRFREDLYYRLKRFLIKIPPLRERKEDIPLLVEHFIKLYDKKGMVCGIAADALDLFMSYNWPGNIRELENAIAQAIVLCSDSKDLTPDLFVLFIDASKPSLDNLDNTPLEVRMREFEKKVILDVLEKSGGNIIKAAQKLGITPRGLRKIIFHLGIKKK